MVGCLHLRVVRDPYDILDTKKATAQSREKKKFKNTLSDLGSRVSLFWILISSNLAEI